MTRKVSTETVYPFVPPLSSLLTSVVAGIKDLYFVIQGDPTSIIAASSISSSSSSRTTIFYEDFVQTRLAEYTAGFGNTVFRFEAILNSALYEVTFTVPHSGGLGQVYNDDGSLVRAVLIYDTAFIIKTGSSLVSIVVEPSRTQWHTEKVTSINFYNIQRCNGVEDQTVLIPLDIIPASSSSQSSGAGNTFDLRFRDGYNTRISFDEGLSFFGEAGIGRGLAPTFGNTIDCASSSSATAFQEGITTVNGVIPVSGNIPIEVSPSLGKQAETGRIRIID
jgi:hypothetical protein